MLIPVRLAHSYSVLTCKYVVVSQCLGNLYDYQKFLIAKFLT